MAAELLGRAMATHQGRVALIVLLVAGLVAAAAYALWQQHRSDRATANPPPPSTTPAGDGRVRIATWNLRKFSDRDRAGQHPPDLVTIARVIRDNQFDVLAVQEVQQQGQVVQKLRRQLNEPWRVAITDQTGNHERYAFLYRADKLELVDGPRLIDGPSASQFDRVPARATFKADQFDFTLVTAHLWYGDKANNTQRRSEAAALARFAKDLADTGPERDVIVLGDFNDMRANSNMPAFRAVGFEPLNFAATNLGSTEVFDNLIVSRAHTREWTGAVGVVNFDETLFANDDKRALEDVSDHRPVWADFSTPGPDDD